MLLTSLATPQSTYINTSILNQKYISTKKFDKQIRIYCLSHNHPGFAYVYNKVLLMEGSSNMYNVHEYFNGWKNK